MQRSGDVPAVARVPWGVRLSDLGYASALYEGVFGRPKAGEVRGVLTRQVHRTLWTRIIDRDMPSGARFYENDIAVLVGVSRLPVRDAVALLVEDGLLVRSGKGIQVRYFSPDEVRSLYDYRALLEGHAASRAAAVLDAEAIESLRTEQANLRREFEFARPEPRYVVDFLLADLRLHDTILAACANPNLMNAMRRIRGQLTLFQMDGMRREEDVRAALDEHELILRSLASKDAEGALSTMKQHILGLGNRVATVLASETLGSGRGATDSNGTKEHTDSTHRERNDIPGTGPHRGTGKEGAES